MKTQGDGFMIVFGEALGAAHAASTCSTPSVRRRRVHFGGPASGSGSGRTAGPRPFRFEPRGEVELRGLADRHALWVLTG